jgi:hypothetical protein
LAYPATRTWKIIWGLLACAALATGLWVVGSSLRNAWQSFHPIPSGDLWASPFFWQAWIQDHLSLGLLWGQNNEHRMFLPRLLFLVDNACFQGRGAFLVACIWLVQGLHAGLWWWVWQRWMKPSFGQLIVAAGLLMALGFWAIQEEVLFWGFQIQYTLPFLAASGCFLSASLAFPQQQAPRPLWFCGALFLAVAATASIASGLTLWPLLGLALLAAGAPRRYLISLFLSAAAMISLYFYHYVSPPGLGHPLHSLGHPLALLRFMAAYLGGPLALLDLRAGLALGSLGLILCAFAVARVRAVGRSHPGADLALGWLLFGTASALLTALGRVDLGIGTAYASRYLCPVIYFWTGAGFFCLETLAASPWPLWVKRVAPALLLTALLPLIVLLQTRRLGDGLQRFSDLDDGALALVVGVEDSLSLDRLLPEDKPLFAWMDFLKSEHLSVYSEAWPWWLGQKIEQALNISPPGSVLQGQIEWCEEAGSPGRRGLWLKGWVQAAAEGASPALIVLVDRDQRICGFGRSGRLRDGLQGGDRWNAWTGYASPGAGPLRAYRVDKDLRSAVLLGACPVCGQGTQALLGVKLQDRFQVVPQDRLRSNVDFVFQEAWKPPLLRLRVQGWAWDPQARRAARDIIAVDCSGVIVGFGRGGLSRPDVGRYFRDTALDAAGWRAVVPQGTLNPAPDFYAMMADGKTVCRMDASRALLIK